IRHANRPSWLHREGLEVHDAPAAHERPSHLPEPARRVSSPVRPRERRGLYRHGDDDVTHHVLRGRRRRRSRGRNRLHVPSTCPSAPCSRWSTTSCTTSKGSRVARFFKRLRGPRERARKGRTEVRLT